MKLIVLSLLISLRLTTNCQSLEKDSVKISYEELRTFLIQDKKALYCDTLLTLKDSTIVAQDGVIVDQHRIILDLEVSKDRNRRWMFGLGAGGLIVGVILGLLVR